MYPRPEAMTVRFFFIEVDGTPLLEPGRKGASVYRARGNYFEPTCHLLSDYRSFGGGAPSDEIRGELYHTLCEPLQGSWPRETQNRRI
jgi:hypothetical protein